MEEKKRKRRTLKEIKDTTIKIRMTNKKKEKLKRFCEDNNMSITKFFDFAMESFILEDFDK